MKLRGYHNDLALLVRYVAGECNERERAEVQALVAVDERKAHLLEEVRLLYTPPAGLDAELDEDAAWQRFDRRVKASNLASRTRVIPLKPSSVPGGTSRGSAGDRSSMSRRTGARRNRPRLGHHAVVVALMLIVAVAAIVAARHTMPGPVPIPEPQERVYTTARGQRMLVRLADGSQVRLNVNSRLTVPADFSQDERRVRLEGEAYFEVAPSEEHPFRITAQGAAVEVLGTTFNVRAYSGEPATQVVVAEGRVAVRQEQMALTDTVVLSHGQMALVPANGMQPVRRRVDVDEHIAWTDGRLVFIDAPLSEVVAQLEVWYDLEVDIAVPEASLRATFNGTFEDEPLSEILKTVAVTLGLRYERDRRHITFYSGPSERIGAQD